jgi:hypothetical protein
LSWSINISNYAVFAEAGNDCEVKFDGSSLFSSEWHKGNPKAETRMKPEIRNPSRSTLRSSARANSDLGRRPTEDGAASKRRARVGPTSRSCGWSRWTCLPLRASNFGFLSDFGLRISTFGHELVPLQLARNRFDRGNCPTASYMSFNFGKSWESTNPTGSLFELTTIRSSMSRLSKIAKASAARASSRT